MLWVIGKSVLGIIMICMGIVEVVIKENKKTENDKHKICMSKQYKVIDLCFYLCVVIEGVILVCPLISNICSICFILIFVINYVICFFYPVTEQAVYQSFLFHGSFMCCINIKIEMLSEQFFKISFILCVISALLLFLRLKIKKNILKLLVAVFLVSAGSISIINKNWGVVQTDLYYKVIVGKAAESSRGGIYIYFDDGTKRIASPLELERTKIGEKVMFTEYVGCLGIAWTEIKYKCCE